MYVNPSSVANLFRSELIKDLNLVESLCCPYCVITYVDGDYEGCCYYDSTGLNCVFEYSNTPVEKVVGYWKEAVLKQMGRLEDDGALLAKWSALLA